MTISLSDMTDDSSTNADNNSGSSGGDDSDALKEAVEAVGGDVEMARKYVEANGSQDDLIAFAESLDDELAQQMEKYRMWNDQHRIRRNFLYDVDGSFETWSGNFYGDSDDPAPETYNFIQQESREMGGNLAFYKALFPEPQEEYWDAEPVLYHKVDLGYGDGQQDSHIYVGQDFVEEYSDFTVEVDGTPKPRPPTDEEIAAMSGDSSGGASASTTDDDAPFNPADFTVPELEEKCAGHSVDELEAVLALEKRDKQRKTAKQEIRFAIDAAEQNEADADSDSTDDTSSEDADLSDFDSDDQMTVTINGDEVTGSKEVIMSLLNDE